ncbi:MAG TPA: leucine-rich repeat domain-containing protein [Verrucomicrobiota bacterium]|nr:leucine-rich repeat domain-containing protein [Verrucomicrobiota bacterium]HQL78722.1 leucine-rich repeat domain-containing protein [Verrucomicrobiota bacterium]
MAATFGKHALALLSTAAWRSRTVSTIRMLPLLPLLALPAAVRGQFILTTNYGAITITGYTGSGGAVTIPDSTNGYPVTRIGNEAFSFCSPLTEITLPDSVTNIGDGAFHACSSLTNVALGTNLVRIGTEAFSSCASLSVITLPGSVTDIGDGAFYMCTSLASITVGTNSPAYSSMDGVLFNKSQTTLIQCPGGKSGSYTVPTSVTNIGTEAFSYCSDLSNVTIPDSVITIGPRAFSFSRLTSVTIPGSVTRIGDRAFYLCTSLSAITVDTNNPTYSSAEGVLFNESQTTLIQCPGGKAGSYAVPNGVTNIGAYAFYYCTSLANMTMPGSVTLIGDEAFVACRNLTTLVIGSNVTGIGTNAFSWCTGLASVTIPAGVRNIGATAFSWCGSLTNVVLPGSVTNIGARAFYSCTSLRAITVDTNNPTYSSLDGVLFNKSQTTLIQCPQGKAGSYTMPESVTSIASYAFAGCARLTGVYFPGDAPGLGVDVFDGANNVTVYFLPGTLGWYTPFGGRPTVVWNPQAQGISVRTNRFGFTITGTANIPIVLEACTNLSSADWIPLESCTLTNGSLDFSDSQWTNYPARFYRIRSP